jgi:hypothetical protein
MNKFGQPYRFQTAFAFVMLVTLALSSFVACVAQDMLPFVVERSVEVFPDARKNKAFSLKQGSALCNLCLYAQAPWRIDSSRIYLRDDKTLWSKRNAKEYFIAYAYAANEYVAIRGDLSKRGKGAGKKKNEKPEFQVTVPKVNLQWDAKHGEASLEEKEDNVPAIIMVSEDANDFGSLIVNAPKDDMSISSPRVTLTWTEGEAVRVYEGEKEVKSGVSWPLMHGTHKVLSVKAIKPLEDVKFTLEGERDVVNGERAVDYVRCCSKVDIVVSCIKFNHRLNTAIDGAVEIRQNYKQDFNGISAGEWIPSLNRNYPICYIARQHVTIKASFEDRTKRLISAKIDALAIDGVVLRSLKPVVVHFSNGKSFPKEVEFQMQAPLHNGICMSQDIYQWRAGMFNGAQINRQTNIYKTGPHKAYIILDEPRLPWQNNRESNQCPWVDALDFVISRAGALGSVTDKDALSAITRYLHSGHGLKYDTKFGVSHYCNVTTSNCFDLTGYMMPVTNIVNCHDQAYALSIMGKLLGINSKYAFMMPFGYIKPVSLVGVGLCNNPFYSLINEEKLIRGEIVFPHRLPFSNHGFVSLMGEIFDACAGPVIGQKLQSYISSTIDVSSPDELRIAGVMKNAGVEGDTIEVQEIENENNQLVLGRPMRNVVLSVNNIK